MTNDTLNPIQADQQPRLIQNHAKPVVHESSACNLRKWLRETIFVEIICIKTYGLVLAVRVGSG
eukprot:1812081-Amphidinium_carterae.1